jgi:hypothetical protein
MGMTTEELVAACDGKQEVTAWRVRRWTREGLIPQPRRHRLPGHRGGTRVEYPDEALAQLQALLGLLRVTRNHARLRILLWLDGYPVPWERVRTDLVASLPSLAEWEAFAAKVAARDEEALDELDRQAVAAVTRGKAPISRRWLRSDADRQTFFAQLLMAGALGRFPLGMSEPVEDDQGWTYGDLIERGFGVYEARTRGTRWLQGPPGAVLEAVSAYKGMDAAHILGVLETATREEAEKARAQIQAAVWAAGLAHHVTRLRKMPEMAAGMIAASVYAQRTPGMEEAIINAGSAKPQSRRKGKARAAS